VRCGKTINRERRVAGKSNSEIRGERQVSGILTLKNGESAFRRRGESMSGNGRKRHDLDKNKQIPDSETTSMKTRGRNVNHNQVTCPKGSK